MAYERQRQSRWDRRHLVTVSTHLTARQHEILTAACRAEGTTPYRIVRDFLQEYVDAAERRLTDSDYGETAVIGQTGLKIYR